MSNPITMVVENIKDFSTGIEHAQKNKTRFIRGSLKRGGKQIRRAFIRKDLSGRPGIKGGKFKKGKQVFSFIKGDNDASLMLHVGISRGLHVHEKGYTFKPTKGGKFLYIRQKGKIVARAKKVVIPARLHFRDLAQEMGPAIVLKAAQEGARAIELSISGVLKKTVGRG